VCVFVFAVSSVNRTRTRRRSVHFPQQRRFI